MNRVCVIEDETIIRNGLIRSVDWDRLECKVVGEASNGVEGYKLIEREMPDIIILDINMPLMNGIELLEKLPKNTYAVIIISGHTEFNFAKKAIEFGVSEYLLKPLDTEELERSLVRAKQQIGMLKRYHEAAPNTPNYRALDHGPVDSVSLNLALKYIEQNYMHKITMDDLRCVTNKSINSITNRFQKHLNMTFSEYLTRYRIQKALELMESREYHLYEIADKVGFSDYKYFNQVFKKIMNASPKLVMTYFARNTNKD